MKKIKYSWDEFDKDIKLLVERIKLEGTVKCLVCIPRGGMVIGVKLSHLLEIPLYQNIKSAILNFDTSEMLLVDDISDTGLTIIQTLQGFINIKVLTLHYKKESSLEPLFYAKIANLDEWVIYPWEV